MARKPTNTALKYWPLTRPVQIDPDPGCKYPDLTAGSAYSVLNFSQDPGQRAGSIPMSGSNEYSAVFSNRICICVLSRLPQTCRSVRLGLP